MRVAIVNSVAHPQLASPEHLLSQYSTLTDWSEAVLAAGASDVRVVQRFKSSWDVTQAGVGYAFRSDAGRFRPSSLVWRQQLVNELARFRPTVVHVNGTGCAADLVAIRRLAGSHRLLVQHHGEGFHSDALRLGYLRRGLACADALLFSTEEQARPWRSARLIGPGTAVFNVMESSTRLAPSPREAARSFARLPGAPAFLWVGRLIENKDPLTVLAAFERARISLPAAHLTFVYQRDELLPYLLNYVTAHPGLRDSVHFRGPIARADMARFYSAADVFVLGSRAEGSGYALIEALACGVPPVVTAIPSFRALTREARVGALWPPGSVEGCAAALVHVGSTLSEQQRARVRAHFDQFLTWDVIGRDALAVYEHVAWTCPAARAGGSVRTAAGAGPRP